MAIRGAARRPKPPAGGTGASGIEHEAVLNTLKALARRGWRTTLVPVDQSGIVSPDRVREALADDTALVSVMHANNEIGTIQPIADIATAAHERGALMHTDAVQSAGKIPFDSPARRHLSPLRPKRTGTKGDVRLRRRGTAGMPILNGGKKERAAGRDGECPALVGFGVAAQLAIRKLPARQRGWRRARPPEERSRDRGCTSVNGCREPRVPNTTNISFDRVGPKPPDRARSGRRRRLDGSPVHRERSSRSRLRPWACRRIDQTASLRMGLFSTDAT